MVVPLRVTDIRSITYIDFKIVHSRVEGLGPYVLPTRFVGVPPLGKKKSTGAVDKRNVRTRTGCG